MSYQRPARYYFALTKARVKGFLKRAPFLSLTDCCWTAAGISYSVGTAKVHVQASPRWLQGARSFQWNLSLLLSSGRGRKQVIRKKNKRVPPLFHRSQRS